MASGIGGNLFSAYWEPATMVSVGASTAVTGLISGGLAMVFVNWKEFDKYP